MFSADFEIFLFNKTVTLFVLFGYAIDSSNSAPRALLVNSVLSHIQLTQTENISYSIKLQLLLQKTTFSPSSFILVGSEEHNAHCHYIQSQHTISSEKSMLVEHADGNSGAEQKPANSHKVQPQSVWNNENTSDPDDGTFSLQSDNTVQAPEAQFISEKQANSFIQMLNDRSQSQLSFVISASEYQDPHRIRDSVKERCNKNHQRFHFLFKVKDLGSAENGTTHSIISTSGQTWGYLSFSSDMTSIQYGSLHGEHLPSNLLKFFLPIFQEVAQLNGLQMTNYPP